MPDKKCPLCSSNRFYVKDPEDAYEMYEFDLENGELVFPEEEDISEVPAIEENTETYCTRCSWHGKFNTL